MNHKNILPAIAALLFACHNPALGEFTIRPYLQNATADSITVCWQTDSSQDSIVNYGIGQAQGYRFRAEGARGKTHRVTLKGLKPGTLYYYQVKSNDDITPAGDKSYFFATAARAGEPFVFAVYGDTRNGLNSYDLDHEMVVHSINRHTMPQFCLALGDLVDKGAEESLWENFFAIEDTLIRHSTIYPIYGDNDLSKDMDSFPKYFELDNHGKWYSFDWGGCHFIGLYIWNIYAQSRKDYLPDSEQYQWLLKDLRSKANQNAYFTVVFFKDSIFLNDKRRSKLLAKHWLPLFEEHGVDLVFSGGAHLYEHSTRNGIKYVVSGGGGAELQTTSKRNKLNSFSVFHHCRVSVNLPSLQLAAVNVNGDIFDSFTLVSNHRPTAGQATTALTGTGSEQEDQPLKEVRLIRGTSKKNKTTPIKLTLFFTDCLYCQEFREERLPALAKKLAIDVEGHFYSLEHTANFEKLISLENKYQDTDNQVPTVFIGNHVLGGEEEIERELEEILRRFK